MGVRSLLKTAAAALCQATGAERLIGSLSGARAMPLVLAYHRVVDDFAAHARRSIPSMLVTTRMLERHLDWLARAYRVVSLDEVGARLESGSPAGDLAAVAFDDGYRDLYEHAFPLLRRKGVPAAVFVVTDLVGTRRFPLHDRLYALLVRSLERWGSAAAVLRFLAQRGVVAGLGRVAGRTSALGLTTRFLVELPQAEAEAAARALEEEIGLPAEDLDGMLPLTWEMLAEMQRGGLTIGSHTRSHALLTSENTTRLRDELAGSRAEIERRVGVEVRHFAYPDGRWNGSAVAAVRAGGYRFGYTTCRHRDASEPLLTIPRTAFWERAAVDGCGRFSPPIMSGHASGLFRILRSCGRDHRLREAEARP